MSRRHILICHDLEADALTVAVVAMKETQPPTTGPPSRANMRNRMASRVDGGMLNGTLTDDGHIRASMLI